MARHTIGVQPPKQTWTPIFTMWVFPKIGVPQNWWFIMEIPIKMDDLGYHHFRKHPCIWQLILKFVGVFQGFASYHAPQDGSVELASLPCIATNESTCPPFLWHFCKRWCSFCNHRIYIYIYIVYIQYMLYQSLDASGLRTNSWNSTQSCLFFCHVCEISTEPVWRIACRWSHHAAALDYEPPRKNVTSAGTQNAGDSYLTWHALCTKWLVTLQHLTWNIDQIWLFKLGNDKMQYMKSTWHSPYKLVCIDPLL